MAYCLNKAQVIGNLTRDPEMRQLPSGQSVANFAVATNRSFTDKEGNKRDDVEFHNIVVWGKLAEICNQYLNKGKKVYIDGRLQTRTWDGQDGVSRSRTEIMADSKLVKKNLCREFDYVGSRWAVVWKLSAESESRKLFTKQSITKFSI